MLSQYSSIQNGADVCRFFNFPTELENYEVEVIVKPKFKKIKKSRQDGLEEFLKSADKYRFSLSNDYKFDRE